MNEVEATRLRYEAAVLDAVRASVDYGDARKVHEGEPAGVLQPWIDAQTGADGRERIALAAYRHALADAGLWAVRYVPECPKGHRTTLELRRVCDGTPTVGGGAGPDDVWLELEPDTIEEADVGGTSGGSDCGVWCSECSEWYDEAECIRDTHAHLETCDMGDDCTCGVRAAEGGPS